MYEKYLSCVSNNSDRRTLFLFRTGSHRLHIEVGRYFIPDTTVMDKLFSVQWRMLKMRHIFLWHVQNIQILEISSFVDI